MSKEASTTHKYNNPGRCPKCNHRLFAEGQVAACPPCKRCPICGYHEFEQKMDFVNFDLLQSMGR